MPKRNTEYHIEVCAPLVRSGLTILVGPISENYCVEAVHKVMEMVREINSASPNTKEGEQLRTTAASQNSEA